MNEVKSDRRGLSYVTDIFKRSLATKLIGFSLGRATRPTTTSLSLIVVTVQNHSSQIRSEAAVPSTTTAFIIALSGTKL